MTKSMRFNFLDFYNLMSAIRKNPSLQASSVMSDTFAREQKERLKLKKPGIARIISFGVSP